MKKLYKKPLTLVLKAQMDNAGLLAGSETDEWAGAKGHRFSDVEDDAPTPVSKTTWARNTSSWDTWEED